MTHTYRLYTAQQVRDKVVEISDAMAHIHICAMPHSCAWHDSYIQAARGAKQFRQICGISNAMAHIYVCAMLHSCMWLKSYLQAVRGAVGAGHSCWDKRHDGCHNRTCSVWYGMTRWCMWHDSSIYAGCMRRSKYGTKLSKWATRWLLYSNLFLIKTVFSATWDTVWCGEGMGWGRGGRGKGSEDYLSYVW